MSNISNARSSFEIPGLVTFGEGQGDLTRIIVTTGDLGPWSQALAEIYPHGATVTRYDRAGRQLLFTSRTSKFEAGKAIRGGVPVIFPWFGPHPDNPDLPQHGFARTADWRVVSSCRHEHGEAAVTLALSSSEATRAVWPFDFELRYTVAVGRRLEMTLEVKNRSASEFRFEEALHTYLSVSDVRLIRITGLESTAYVDKVGGSARHRSEQGPLTFSGETDRVFVNTSADCRVHDPVHGDVAVRKSGSLSTVVWNPWQKKAESLPDLAGDQWHTMVCVEAANVMENAIILAPGATHTMQAVIEAQS